MLQCIINAEIFCIYWKYFLWLFKITDPQRKIVSKESRKKRITIQQKKNGIKIVESCKK